jgi:hypothetical protein
VPLHVKHQVDPDVLPNIPADATVATPELIITEDKEARRIYDNHVNMDDAVKAQVINIIHHTCLCELRNNDTGCSLGATTLNLLDHLLDRHGRFTPADVKACKRRIVEPIDSTQPIDIFFERVDNRVQHAVDGHVAFSAEHILQATYHAVSTF